MVNECKCFCNEELKDQLIEFIVENYVDVNLGLIYLLECFCFYLIYVLKYFKEQIGINVIDYIN